VRNQTASRQARQGRKERTTPKTIPVNPNTRLTPNASWPMTRSAPRTRPLAHAAGRAPRHSVQRLVGR